MEVYIMSGIREPEVTVTENKTIAKKQIFIDAKDKNIATTVIYTANGTKFTYDAEGKVTVPTTDMFDLFVKGVVAVKNNVYYKPTSCTEAGVITFPFPS